MIRGNLYFLLVLCLLFIVASCNEDTNPCQDVQCQNGGVCQDGTCQCPPGWGGLDCSLSICGTAYCQNGGLCVDNVCQCPDGYFGEFCENASCAVMNCPEHSDCQEDALTGIGNCACHYGYEGAGCTTITRNMLMGNYSASGDCSGGDEGLVGSSVQLEADQFSHTHFLIKASSPTYGQTSLRAQLTSIDTIDQTYRFSIPKQTASNNMGIEMEVQSSGLGKMTPDSIGFNYSVHFVESNNTQSCQAILQR